MINHMFLYISLKEHVNAIFDNIFFDNAICFLYSSYISAESFPSLFHFLPVLKFFPFSHMCHQEIVMFETATISLASFSTYPMTIGLICVLNVGMIFVCLSCFVFSLFNDEILITLTENFCYCYNLLYGTILVFVYFHVILDLQSNKYSANKCFSK